MKSVHTALATIAVGFVSVVSAFANVQPIPGSITYGNHSIILEKAPVGSTFFHTFSNGDGRDIREIYRVEADRSVKLVARSTSNAS